MKKKNILLIVLMAVMIVVVGDKLLNGDVFKGKDKGTGVVDVIEKESNMVTYDDREDVEGVEDVEVEWGGNGIEDKEISDVKEEKDKLFAYTDSELKELGKKRDPFSIQKKIVEMAMAMEKEYQANVLRLEAEKNKGNSDKEEGNEEGEVGEGDNLVEGKTDEGNDNEKPEEELDNPPKILTKEELQGTVVGMSKKYGVPQSWVYAVIDIGSKYDMNKVNENKNVDGGTLSYDRGLMQINSKTSPWIAKQLTMQYEVGMEFDPEVNIEMGVYYLKYLREILDDEDFIFTAYNRGATGANKYKEMNGTYESEYSIAIKELINKSK